jgi:hypothetical protein
LPTFGSPVCGAMIMRIESWHRNHAVLMASHLPTNIEDARLILKLVNELVETFLAASEPGPVTERGAVVTLVKGDGRCPS